MFIVYARYFDALPIHIKYYENVLSTYKTHAFELSCGYTFVCLLLIKPQHHGNIRYLENLPSLAFPFHLLPSPVHPTGSSFCFFPGFLAIFILLPSNNKNIPDFPSVCYLASLLFLSCCRCWLPCYFYLVDEIAIGSKKFFLDARIKILEWLNNTWYETKQIQITWITHF